MSEKKKHPGSERPALETVNNYYRGYVEIAEGDNLFDALEIALDRTLKIGKAFPANAGLLKYAADKWTINELIQHVIDTERIFCYRALRYAREDATNLMGFDHDAYVPASMANRRRTDLLLKELIAVRMATISLFVSFTEAMLLNTGSINDQATSVQTLGWVIAGHNEHHMQMIKKHYLKPAY